MDKLDGVQNECYSTLDLLEWGETRLEIVETHNVGTSESTITQVAYDQVRNRILGMDDDGNLFEADRERSGLSEWFRVIWQRDSSKIILRQGVLFFYIVIHIE